MSAARARAGHDRGVPDELLGALLASSARGNESAFAALLDRTANVSLAIARCATQDEETAELATHGAFVEIWRQARLGRVPEGDLLMWVLGVVRRHALVARVAA